MEPWRNRQGLTEQEFLAQYDAGRYERPSVTVDMLIFTVTNQPEDNYRKLPEKALQVLLIRRADHPYLGQWALPGGFVAMTEGLDAAAARELKEETNIDHIYMEQLYSWGDVGRDPRTRVISVSYMSLVDATALQIRAGQDAAAARWFSVQETLLQEGRELGADGTTRHQRRVALRLTAGDDSLSATLRIRRTVHGRVTHTERQVADAGGIAFDHAKIVHYGLERLRSKIEWTDIAFNLMPELFTLTELQQVYEIILGRELLTANFRRKIAHMVRETNQFAREAGHRPAKLFRFNPNWAESAL